MALSIHPEAVEHLLFLIVLAPLVGAAVNGLFGKWLGRANVNFIANAAVGIAFLVSLGALISVYGAEGRPLTDHLFPWIHAGGLSIDVTFYVDHLTAVMLMVITGVGFFIHVYSTGYMAHDEGYWRYFAYLNLFVAMMLILVLGDSLPLIFVGWEGVGLCSYLLIGFWYDDTEKSIAGMKAFVVNRVGDFGFLIGMFTLFALFGTLNIPELHALSGGIHTGQTIAITHLFGGWTYGAALTLAMGMIFLGCTGKSAQIPLFVWLPDAMAGPTPVSALIHAATMVTAGVYLLSRLSFFLVLTPAIMMLVAFIGALTALVGAYMGLFQNGIKKVLAYSTVSQLGYMFMGVGVASFAGGVYHLVTHAFFKGLLFLAAGSVMHALSNEEDIRKMGGLAKVLPHTHKTFLIATFAITGVLPLSGFFSKDGILHAVLSAHLGAAWFPWLLWGMGTLGALFTSIYMWRLYFLTFRGEPRSMELHEHAHESPASMTLPLWVLAIGAIVTAWWGLAEVINAVAGTHLGTLESWLEPAVTAAPASVAGGEGSTAMLLLFLGIALAVAWAGLGIAWVMWGRQGVPADAKAKKALGPIYTASFAKLWWDEAYDLFFVRPLIGLSNAVWWSSTSSSSTGWWSRASRGSLAWPARASGASRTGTPSATRRSSPWARPWSWASWSAAG